MSPKAMQHNKLSLSVRATRQVAASKTARAS